MKHRTEGAGGDTSATLAQLLGAHHHGDERVVLRLCSPTAPREGGVVVLSEPTSRELRRVADSDCRTVVCREPSGGDERATLYDDAAAAGVTLVLVGDVPVALARLTRHFDRRPALAAPGVHASATVDPSASLGHGVRVGAGAVIGPGAVVGDDVTIGALASAGAGCRIGAGSTLHERVVLADGVLLGARCRVQAGAVIGADGFGYAFGPSGAEKIHHLGSVIVGDDVEIGANTCVDRGTLDATRIGDRCKIDNLVQIGHNVQIGCDVVVAGCCAIAGSVRIEDGAVLGGSVGIADHVRVGAGAQLAGRAGVTKPVPAGATWGGFPAQPMRRWARERYLINRLETLWGAHRARSDDELDG